MLDNNNFPNESRIINEIAIEYNPDYYDAWRGVLANVTATEKEKETAKENLLRLDPLNPKWK